MRACVVLLTIAVGIAVGSGETAGITWEALLDRADSLSLAGNPDSAGIVLDFALSETTTAYAESDTTEEIQIYRDGAWQHYYFRNYTDAESLYTRALRIRERAADRDVLAYAQALMDLAVVYRQGGKHTEAVPLYERALKVREEAQGPDHPDVGRTAQLLGRLYRGLGRYPEAQSLLERKLAIAEQSPDPENLDTATALGDLAILCSLQGKSYEALDLYERELAIRERIQGPEHASVAQCFNNMAIEARVLGRLDEAESLNRKALAMREKIYGKDHTEVAESLNGLALVAWQKGKYLEAETTLKRALEIYEKAFGRERSEVATTKSYLGILYSVQGRYAEAEPLLTEALEVVERLLGPEHPDVADQLNNLANLYADQNNYAEAEPLYKRAMAILEKTVGSDNPALGESMSNLAIAYAEQGRYSEAEPLDKRVIALFEKLLGPDHPYVAVSIEHLASSYKDQGRYEEAEPLYHRAIAIVEKAYGPEHPDMAVDLNNLADLYMHQARFEEADSLLKRTLAINRTVLGPNDYNTALAVESISRLRRLQGRPDEAMMLAAEAANIRFVNFHENAFVLSEKDALLYSWDLRNTVNLYLTFYLDSGLPGGDTAVETADVIFSNKGQVSDGIFDRQHALVQETDSVALALAEDLRNTKFQLSEFFVYGPEDDVAGYRIEVDSLSRLVNELEADLSRRSASFRKREEYRKVGTERITSLLPETSVLVEYVKYDYAELESGRTLPRYMAVVVGRGRDPVVLDIGEASEIDALVEAYRTHMLAISASGRPPTIVNEQDYMMISEDLLEKTWQPLQEYVAGSGLVLIAGDGALNIVSFAGLVDEDGTYLVEKYPIHYLSSGRDLIRLADEVAGGMGLFALGDPAYDSAPARSMRVDVVAAGDAGTAGFAVRNVRLSNAALRDLNLTALPGTRNEVEQIGEAWSQATGDPVTIYLGNEASEDRFKKDAPGSKVIHLATHGYFLEGAHSGEDYVGGNPLLLSGLFLSGANLRGEAASYMGTEDGILTAYEVSAMDLTGTEMVVLSACETGLGRVEEGEGVYGLRRAFQMAGARTVISALWPVSDKETAGLMGDLYTRTGESIPETMRRIQIKRIEAIRTGNRPDHPYTWAGFIAIGDWD